MLTIKQGAGGSTLPGIFFFVCFFTCVEHLLDDHGHLPLQHGVEQLDDEDEAGAEDEQRQGQEHEAHRQVRQISVGEDVFACNGKRWVKEMIGIKASTLRLHYVTAKNSLVRVTHFTASCL